MDNDDAMLRFKQVAESMKSLTEHISALIILGRAKGQFTSAEFQTALAQAGAIADQEYAAMLSAAREKWKEAGQLQSFERIFGDSEEAEFRARDGR